MFHLQSAEVEALMCGTRAVVSSDRPQAAAAAAEAAASKWGGASAGVDFLFLIAGGTQRAAAEDTDTAVRMRSRAPSARRGGSSLKLALHKATLRDDHFDEITISQRTYPQVDTDMFALNTISLMAVTKAALKGMLKRRSGRVVVVRPTTGKRKQSTAKGSERGVDSPLRATCSAR